MRFTELDLFGVYVAPITVMMIAARLLLVPLGRIANRFGLLQRVWHPVLFGFAVYIIVLASIVAAVSRWG